MAIAIEVRRARAEDVEGIAACLASAFAPFRSQYTRGAYEDTVPNPEAVRERMLHMTVYVAIAPYGEIVGTVASSVKGADGHLRGTAVRPEWHGHAVGEHLLRTVEHDLAAAGCTRVTLNTTVPLQRAIRFYQRNGYAASGKIGDFFGMPLQEYVKPLMPGLLSSPP